MQGMPIMQDAGYNTPQAQEFYKYNSEFRLHSTTAALTGKPKLSKEMAHALETFKDGSQMGASALTSPEEIVG